MNTGVPLDRFLVCGLGSIGQHCAAVLKEFGVAVIAIEAVQPPHWDIPDLPSFLDDLILGDCRQDSILQQAQIHRCRSALIVTSNDRVNVETALSVRKLNPQTRLVFRSSQESLTRLLGDRLGNFVAFNPSHLPALAFALAALGTETLGVFQLDGRWVRVVQQRLYPSHPWSNGCPLYELNGRTRRILGHTPNVETISPSSFHQWHPETQVNLGDTLVYVEVTESKTFSQAYQFHPTPPTRTPFLRLGNRTVIRQQVQRIWQACTRDPVRRMVLASSSIVLLLLGLGTVLLQGYYPDSTWRTAFYATAILLLGGYGDLFGVLAGTFPIPGWLQLFSFMLTLLGTAFVGGLYALLIDALLSAKFQFAYPRPPVPQQGHVAIVGLGRVGQQVAKLLETFKQPIVGITLNPDFDQTILPHVSLVSGNWMEVANLGGAKSFLALTDDDLINLEVCLTAQMMNPYLHLVVRTSSRHWSQDFAQLLPGATVLCTYDVAAEAFAGAAFGENILSLFRWNHQTLLVTEYRIEVEDTLNGLLLAEVAYGYDVVPVLHQTAEGTAALIPSEDRRLHRGDRLVILATIEGLRRIEVGRLDRTSRQTQVYVESALTPEAAFEGARTIARFVGCHLGEARDFMGNLPNTWHSPLYFHQAHRLVRELRKVQVSAHVIPPG